MPSHMYSVGFWKNVNIFFIKKLKLNYKKLIKLTNDSGLTSKYRSNHLLIYFQLEYQADSENFCYANVK